MGQKQIYENKIKEYEELLQKSAREGKIKNWKINTYTNRKSNIYVESNYKIESILNSKREDFIFTIYKDYDELIGESSFTLNPEDDIDKFKKELEDAIFVCSHSKSKKYELPKADDKLIEDKNINYDIFYNKRFEEDFLNQSLSLFFEEKINNLKKLVEDNSDDSIKLKVNYLEILNSLSERTLKTDLGIEKSFKKEKCYMEFVVTAINLSNNEEKEYIVYENINDPYSYDFEGFFAKTIDNAKDAIISEKAKDYNGKIILSQKAALDFFCPDLSMNSIVGHCSSRLKFLGISQFELGKDVINNPKFDKITLSSNPLLEGNMASSPYDVDGITAKKITLIENNVFMNFFASKQYADYLKVEPTGPFGVVEIECGSKSCDELFDDDTVVIDTFASFAPDMVSGDFSAEIRLGYYIKDGKKIPFKGGLFTGNIFKILEEVELSKEKMNVPKYFGPKCVKFHKGEIVGV